MVLQVRGNEQGFEVSDPRGSEPARDPAQRGSHALEGPVARVRGGNRDGPREGVEFYSLRGAKAHGSPQASHRSTKRPAKEFYTKKCWYAETTCAGQTQRLIHSWRSALSSFSIA